METGCLINTLAPSSDHTDEVATKNLCGDKWINLLKMFKLNKRRGRFGYPLTTEQECVCSSFDVRWQSGTANTWQSYVQITITNVVTYSFYRDQNTVGGHRNFCLAALTNISAGMKT